jgi:hypothetical protein
MRRKRKRRLIAAVVAVAVIGLFLPLPVREADRERVVRNAVVSLLEDRRVFLDWKYIPLYDSGFINKAKCTLFYRNDTSLSSGIFDELGIQALPEDYRNRLPPGWLDQGNVLIEITFKDVTPKAGRPHLRFNCYHGSLAAQGYKVRVYRCLLGAFGLFSCEWVS